jgi:hypothetical protein
MYGCEDDHNLTTQHRVCHGATTFRRGNCPQWCAVSTKTKPSHVNDNRSGVDRRAGKRAIVWDTDSTFIVSTPAGEIYRCGVTQPCQPLAITPGFGGPYVIPARGA